MTIYFVFYFALIAFGFFLSLADFFKYDAVKKLYLTVVFISMTLLAGSRGLTVGYDTWVYNEFFSTIAASRFYAPWEYNGYMEYGFYMVCALFRMIGLPARFLFYFWGGLIAGSVCIFIYKNSKNVPFSTFSIPSIV